jgi:hypothetical protein
MLKIVHANFIKVGHLLLTPLVVPGAFRLFLVALVVPLIQVAAQSYPT